MEWRGKGKWHERVLAKHRTCAYVSQENENQSFVVWEEDGELETCARRGLWPSCLRISLARKNQSAVVRLTTGCSFCLFVFFRLDNANVLAQVLLLAAWRLTCYRLAVEHEEAYPLR